MNALSDLASEVKFRERMRGYDYEEVDSYVETVGRAAAHAKDRIAQLEHRLSQAEPQTGGDDGAAEIRETLLRTLVLAQRTADSAVSEARAEAKSITDSAQERAAKTVSEAETAADERLRSAEERAARMLAESEESGQLIIVEAKRTAAAELASERERAQAELRDLEASKSELETVVAEIEARLDSERDMLRSLAVSFQAFVGKFEPAADAEACPGEAESEQSATAQADAEQRAADAEQSPAEQAEARAGSAEQSPAEESPAEQAEARAGSAEQSPAEQAEAQADAAEQGADADGSGPVAEDATTDDGAEALEASGDVAGGEEALPSEAGDSRDDQAVAAGPGPAGGSALGFLPAPEDAAPASEGALGAALPAGAVDAEPVPDLPVADWDDEVGRDRSEDLDAAAPEAGASDAAQSEAPTGGNGSTDRSPGASRRGDEVAFAGPATVPFGVDSPELFDMDAEEDDEFIEQLRQVVSSDAPLPDGDAAMAAFFDHDDGPGPARSAGAANRGGRPQPARSAGAANRGGGAGARSGASDGGGRLGPRA